MSLSEVRRELEDIVESLEEREEEEGEERAWESTDSVDEKVVFEKDCGRVAEVKENMTRVKWKKVGEFLLEEVTPMLGLIGPVEGQRVIEHHMRTFRTIRR